MGESDLLLGPHGEGGTEHTGIAPYGRPYAPWAWRTHKVASPVTSHIHRSESSLQEKDGPELGADFPSR